MYFPREGERVKFSWDPEKEKANKRTHNVSFSEACTVFSDKFELTLYDKEHSEDEERWITLGQTVDGNLLVVVHTFGYTNEREHVRIISARNADKSEMKQYFERRG